MSGGGTVAARRRPWRTRLVGVALLGVTALMASLLPGSAAAAASPARGTAPSAHQSTHQSAPVGAADSATARQASEQQARKVKRKKKKKKRKAKVAAAVPRVFGVTRADQDWYNGKLKVKWTRVSGVTYQLRWADSVARLGSARVVGTASPYGVYVGPLDRGKTWQFQVRAVRSGKVGAWSTARGLRFINYWPKGPSLAPDSQQTDAVSFKWPAVPYASRYRVQYSPAWFGSWPGSATYTSPTPDGWVSQSARSTTLSLPTRPAFGDRMLAVDYANPVFAQLEANNQYVSGASQRSAWTLSWPTPPTPEAGDAVHLGSYNVMVPTDARVTAVAENISSHGLTIVALQEAGYATAAEIVTALGPTWSRVASGNGAAQQILYRNDLFTVTGSGQFAVPNPKTPSSPLVTPWAKFAKVGAIPDHNQSFYVVSVHFSEDASKTPLEKNRDTGLAAQAVIDAMNGVNTLDEPMIVAGDLRYGREPYGDIAGYTAAHPTFIRDGFYDSMASLSRIGSNYSGFNGLAAQTPHPSGLGPRSDHILLKGFRGSFKYVNVANWTKNGAIPSDHNLIYSELAIPFDSY